MKRQPVSRPSGGKRSKAGLQKKRNTIWKIAIRTTAEAEDAVMEALSTAFVESPSAYTDADTGKSTAAVYCANPPANLDHKLKALRARLRRIKQTGLRIGPARVSVQRLRDEDWAESWKRHFKPIEIGTALLVRPSWSRHRGRKSQKVVTLDPGLSFGTGHHPTTAFCLKQLVRRRKQRWQKSFLDIGTGSGILAIAAVKFGYVPVHAVDHDPVSVRVALANARKNRVTDRLRIKRSDVTKLPSRAPRRYDFICANLTSTLLVSGCRLISGLLRPDGVLVLAGILDHEFSQVRKAYERLGFRLVASKREKEWRSGTFSSNSPTPVQP
jgi:ribosomal protein L11 methyltransferase